jgi:hypothetical protein
MGGERASTARQRIAGEICCMCKKILGPAQKPIERYCDQCGRHKVYMSYFRCKEWIVQFLEPDGKTLIGRIITFADADKIRELIARTPTQLNLEARNMLEHSISQGRGGLFLELTNEQYIRLGRNRVRTSDTAS